jgi:hypothetical protein
VVEPGLDRHEWETEWQGLAPLVVDSPSEALPELDAAVDSTEIGAAITGYRNLYEFLVAERRSP